MFGALFGGMAAAGNSNTLVNYSNGGRGKLSRLSCALFALAVMVFMGPVISRIPMAVLSAVLIVFSLQAVDKWSLKHLRLLLHGTLQGLPDLLVMLGVMSIMLVFGVLEAVGAGIVVSLFLFIHRMGREVIRHDQPCGRLRSCAMRNDTERELLDSHGDRIRVIQIEGALFFGTVDNVVARVEAYAGTNARYIVLDMRRITEVDGTGAEMLLHLREYCRRQQQELLLSGVDTREADNAFLKSIGTLDVFTEQAHFVYLNDAIEAAEESLLDSILGESRYTRELRFHELDIIRDFRQDEIARLSHYFEKQDCAPGDFVFRQGEPAGLLYLLARGKVRIVRAETGVPEQTVSSLSPGFAFGEMALKPGRTRYGSACAVKAVTCYGLNRHRLEQLGGEEPELAFRFLAAMATDLSDRIGQSATSVPALHI
jgi:CRP-like cAMP-binding protein/anti-anti-sigma regulatory factor